MSTQEGLQIVLYIALLIAATPILGGYMARVFTGQRVILTPVLRPAENALYRLSGLDPQVEQSWRGYALALLMFNALGFAVLFALLVLQGQLPLNPEGWPGVPTWLAFNTTASFVTNTNWQAYAGEVTLSYLSQMLGLAVQNFLSAATGMAVLVALARGLARQSAATVGNFGVDATRAVLYVLLPLASLLAVVLVSQGVVQTLASYAEVTTLEGESQEIPVGPAASQVAIKQLGSNGGGFFNTNSAHPLENPTSLSNFLQMLSLLLIPAALTFTYGRLVGSLRQGWAIFAVMLVLFCAGLAIMLVAEYEAAPATTELAALEGKETRLGIGNSVLWAMATTSASNGSVNAMHSSLSPAAGGVALFNIMLGEVIFGGVGAGLYGMLIFVVLAVFISGLMVGRTPEYLGKKIEAHEVKLVIIAVLLPSACILLGAAAASVYDQALASRANAGPHGLSEILYAFSSASQNNGSAFAGFNANTDFYNIVLGLCMLIGRFGVILPMLAVAGSLAAKKRIPPSAGTLPTDGPLFVAVLLAVVVVVGGLTFFPALALGPIAEQLLLNAGRTF
ncbi:MAG: potassium-transporting ATPase subunit KdpA [Anaerolineae bacterium]|nr:potassium-transporting ATPase subunit KdpA [Anaerolineae bacterium]